jgi:hypothetical protein
VAITAALTLALSLNLATCVRWLEQPDDGFARMLSYMAAHVPAGARVTDGADALPGPTVVQYGLAPRYRVGLWLTPAARSREHVRYIVVPWAQVNDGYSFLAPSQVRRLVGPGRLVFSFHGRTYGNLALYQLPLP